MKTKFFILRVWAHGSDHRAPIRPVALTNRGGRSNGDATEGHQGASRRTLRPEKKKEQQLQVIIFEKLLTKRQTDEPDWRMVKVHFDELSTTVVCGFRHTWKFCNANQISRKIWTRWLGKKTYRARDFCWNFNHEDLSFMLKIHQNHYTAPLLRHHIHSIQSIFVTL